MKAASSQVFALSALVFVFLLFLFSPIGWIAWWLYIPGLIIVPMIVLSARRSLKTVPSPSEFVLLAVFAYGAVLLANCAAFGLIEGDYLVPIRENSPSDFKFYGLYGIPSAIWYVGYLFFSLRDRN